MSRYLELMLPAMRKYTADVRDADIRYRKSVKKFRQDFENDEGAFVRAVKGAIEVHFKETATARAEYNAAVAATLYEMGVTA